MILPNPTPTPQRDSVRAVQGSDRSAFPDDFGLDRVVEVGGDRTVALGGGVLVAQRRARRGVADARHQFLGGDAWHPCGQSGRVVAEVVQAKALRRTRRRARRAPRVGHTGSAGGLAQGAGEHHAFGPALGIGGEVVVERLHDDGRHDDGADARVGLGLLHDPALPRDLLGLHPDVHLGVQQVHVAPA